MEQTVFDDILSRLALVERRLDGHESRLAGLEKVGRAQAPSLAAELSVRRTPPSPPPVQYQAPKPEAPPTAPAFETAPEPKKAKPSVNAEYQIGARILPYAGATLFILGLAYLVSLGVGRGFITPAMLWWGVNLLSLAFIGVGQAKRDEREQFGQILTAIGSCGFYLNFAAGHVFQRLYDGEMLVGLFVAHSLVNLGYAFWRSSRAFLALGLFGGLIAALMPLREQNYTMHVALQFLILAPATLIAARNKWIDASMWIYAAGTATMLPVSIDVRAPNELRVAAILGTAVLTVAGYAWSYRKLSFDRYGLFAPLALFLNGLIGFLCFRNEAGAGAMVLYGAAIAVSAMAFAKDKGVRDRMLIAAVAIPATLAPFGFALLPSIWLFLGLSAVFALASRRVPAASVLASVELALAMTVYLLAVLGAKLYWVDESLVLLGGGAAITLATWALTKAYRHSETLVLGASMLAVPIVARLAKLVLGMPEIASPTLLSIAVGLLAASVGASVLATITRWESARNLLWTVFSAAYLMLVLVVLDQPPLVGIEVLLLGSFAGVLALSARLSREKDELVIAAAALGVPLITRLVQVLLTSLVGWPLLPAVVFGVAVATAGLCVFVWRRRSTSTVTLLWGVYLLGYALLAVSLLGWRVSFEIQLTLLLSYLALAAFVAWVGGAKVADQMTVGAFTCGVPLVAWMARAILMGPSFGWSKAPALALGLAISTVGAAALATRNRTREAPWLLYGTYLAGYLFLLLGSNPVAPPIGIELTVIGAYLAATVVGARARDEKGIWGYASAMGGLLIIRLADIILSLPAIGFDRFAASILGACVVALAVGWVSASKRMRELAVVSTMFTVAAGGLYWWAYLVRTLPLGQDVLAVTAIMASLIATTISLLASYKEQELVYVSAGLFWAVASRLGFLVLTGIGIKTNASLSVTWTLVGLGFLAVGFLASVRQLRYMSFLVFGSTVCKVLLVDLVDLDPAIRVVILLLLGIVMLGGGYWYIRVQRPESA